MEKEQIIKFLESAMTKKENDNIGIVKHLSTM